MSDYFGKEVPKLGFGLMRLPHKGLGTDTEQTKKMVDMFLDAGFTYFDTAYVYPGSEAAIKKALVDRYPITHGGSGFSNSLSDIRKLCPGADITDGLAIIGDDAATCDKDVERWLKNIGLL